MNGYDISVNSSMKRLFDRLTLLEQRVSELEMKADCAEEFEYALTDKGRELLEQAKK